jgi:hypothetical protein
MVVRVTSRRSGLRCAYCYDAAAGATACAACGTLLHDDCRVLAGRCTTLGCLSRIRCTVAPRGAGWRDVLVTVAVVTLVVGGLFALAVVRFKRALRHGLEHVCTTTCAEEGYAPRPSILDHEITTRIPGG